MRRNDMANEHSGVIYRQSKVHDSEGNREFYKEWSHKIKRNLEDIYDTYDLNGDGVWDEELWEKYCDGEDLEF